MDQERWDRIAALFAGALDAAPEDRAAYLGSACPDPSLRAEVEAMLAAHEQPSSLRLEQRLVSDEAGSWTAGLPAGTRIGPYRIESLIGRGGMGEVYRGERADGTFEQTVAIKLLRADGGGGDLVRRFQTERSLLARLSHPNIAAILDGGTASDGRPYLVLRHVDGRPITEFASTLPVADRLRLLIKVARAVQFAHARLVVHRDLKPSNILVTADGEPILLDFGIAKLLDPHATDPDQTRTGQRLLTPSHAAPEQLRGDPITTATDVYGLGALLFELLTGARLHASATTASQLERAILETPAPLPSALAPAADRAILRGDLDRIVQMALRKEPERRYQSAGQLAEDLDRYLAGQPVIAQPDTWSYRTRRFVSRNRVAAIAGVAFLGLIAGGALREMRQRARIAGERDRAVREQAAGEEVLRFVTNLFQQSDPRVVPGGDTLRVAAFLDRAEAEASRLADQPEQQMRIFRVLGNVRASRGDYAAAESLLTLARNLGTSHLGADHAAVLQVDQLLGGVIRERRGIAAARPVFAGVLERARRILGPDHPDLATSYANLAAVIEAPDSIRTLLDSAVAIRSRNPGGDSTEIASGLDDQARERGLRGRYAEAVALDQAALRILLARFPRDHPYSLTVIGNLASWKGYLAQWDEALALAEEVLAAARKQATPGEGLGLAYERVALQAVNLPGRQSRADSALREALAVFRAKLSPEHGLITNSMRNRAIVLAAKGDVAEGLALLDSAIARTRSAGEAENTAYMTGQRVPLLVRLGRHDEAARSAAAAALFRDRLPRGSTRAADIDYWSGLAALAAGQPDLATGTLQSAVDQLATRFPEGHPRRGQFACLLGVARARTGNRDSARPLLTEGCASASGWGLADPTVIAWGRLELRRVDVQIGGRASR